MAEVEAKKKTAPYLPFKTFLNSLDVFTHGLPTILDRTIWKSQSNVMQGLIMNTYRFLGLVEEYDEPSDALEKMVQHPEQRAAVLRGLIESTYGNEFGRDFSATTPKLLESMFEETYAVTGATKQKAITFFLKAARFANITLSPFLLNQIRSSTNRRKRGKTRESGSVTPKENGTTPQLANTTNGNSHMIQLASGGAVTISITANPFKTSPEDREFIFGLIDALQKYEATHEVDEGEDEQD
jgi:hypothetical protein